MGVPVVGTGTLATTEPVRGTATVTEVDAGARVGGPEASVPTGPVARSGTGRSDSAVSSAGPCRGCGMAQARYPR